jgi:hypothetical protein
MRIKSAQLFMQDIRVKKQPRSFRDVLFAIVFYGQVAIMIWLAVRFGPSAFWNAGRMTEEAAAASSMADAAEDDLGVGGSGVEDTGVNEQHDTTLQVRYNNVIKMAVACGFFACALSGLALLVLTIFFCRVVPIALIASIVMSFTWGTVGIGLHPTSFVPITGIIALAFCIGYTFVIWDQIPFASDNLHTALQGVRSHLSVAVVAYAFQALALVWSVLWCFAFTSVYDHMRTCSGGGGGGVGGTGGEKKEKRKQNVTGTRRPASSCTSHSGSHITGRCRYCR